MIKTVIAFVLAGHGFAHLVGFVVPWRISQLEEMPYKTTLLGGLIDVGDTGIRIMGILWLLNALAYFAGAVGVFLQPPWWQGFILYISIFSLLLCISGWPYAKIGIFVNVVIIIVLLLAAGRSWLPGAAS